MNFKGVGFNLWNRNYLIPGSKFQPIRGRAGKFSEKTWQKSRKSKQRPVGRNGKIHSISSTFLIKKNINNAFAYPVCRGRHKRGLFLFLCDALLIVLNCNKGPLFFCNMYKEGADQNSPYNVTCKTIKIRWGDICRKACTGQEMRNGKVSKG